MEDFTKIGLLDFQFRGGQNNLFHSSSQNTGLLPATDFSTFQVGQSSNFRQKEIVSTVPGCNGHNSTATTWNLEEMMEDLSLMYVSGDMQGVEGEKLQFCTSQCCNSRVKYARVCREKENPSSMWDNQTTNSTWDIPRQVPNRDMLSSWDLGSDGASTPGSGYNCWSANNGGQPWAGAVFSNIVPSCAPLEQNIESHLLEDPENFDSWAEAGCESLLGSEVFQPMTGDLVNNDRQEENKWNRIKRKPKKTKSIK